MGSAGGSSMRNELVHSSPPVFKFFISSSTSWQKGAHECFCLVIASIQC